MGAERSRRGESIVIPYEEFLRARMGARGGSAPAAGGRPSTSLEGGAPPAAEDRRTLREEVDSLPEVRRERVSAVRDRIREGYYDRPEVLEEILDRLVALFRGEKRRLLPRDG